MMKQKFGLRKGKKNFLSEMKILHVLANADGSMGGAERHLLDLASAQVAENWEVSVASHPNGELTKKLNEVGAKVYPWTGSRSNPRTYHSLRRTFHDCKPDLVHAHMAKSASIAGRWVTGIRSSSTPLLSTAHNLVKGKYFSKSDYVICVSNKVRETLLGQGCPESQCEVIHNWVDTERFSKCLDRPTVREQLNFPQDAFVMVLLGRIHRVKGHDFALEALAGLRSQGVDGRLLFLGEGSFRKEVEAMVGGLELTPHVRFLGHHPNPEEVLPSADVLIMPSQKEGLPLALIEAMACGLAPVASRVGGIPEVIVPQENGLLFEPGDLDEFVGALLGLHRDRHRLRALAEKARATAREKFSPAVALPKVNSVYKKLLE